MKHAILRRTQAFTLVELLVTVAIIGVLCALLSAAVPSVLSTVKRSKCCSNLKQIGVLVANYASANNGELPPTRENGLFSFVGNIMPDVKFGNQANLQLGKLFFCPADTSGGVATYSLPESSTTTPAAYVRSSDTVIVKGLCPLPAFPRPSQTFLLVEAPSKERTYTQNGNGSIVTPQKQYSSGGIGIHDKKGANYLFLDGHVEFISLPMALGAGYGVQKLETYDEWETGFKAR